MFCHNSIINCQEFLYQIGLNSSLHILYFLLLLSGVYYCLIGYSEFCAQFQNLISCSHHSNHNEACRVIAFHSWAVCHWSLRFIERSYELDRSKRPICILLHRCSTRAISRRSAKARTLTYIGFLTNVHEGGKCCFQFLFVCWWVYYVGLT